MGFTRNEVTSVPRGLLHLGSILACDGLLRPSAVHFCGTILQFALTGRYPAPCPTEPGLSSRSLSATGDCLLNFPQTQHSILYNRSHNVASIFYYLHPKLNFKNIVKVHHEAIKLVISFAAYDSTA